MKCDGCFGASFDDCKRCKKMTGKEYQKLAMRTCSIPYDNKEGRLHHAVFGLTSEAGEVAGILQKVYQGHEFDKEHIKKELGDCLWMIAEACEALDLDMDDVVLTGHFTEKKVTFNVLKISTYLHYLGNLW